jgi:hypothetical protein
MEPRRKGRELKRRKEQLFNCSEKKKKKIERKVSL